MRVIFCANLAWYGWLWLCAGVLTGSVAVAQGDPLDDLFVCGDGLFRLEEESHGM